MVTQITNSSVYIVVLNWKNITDTLELLESLDKVNYKNFKLCLIDNFSNDGSVQSIEDWLNNKNYNYDLIKSLDEVDSGISKNSKVHLLANNENSGFAKGSNLGIEIAIKLNFDYVLLLNNDVVVEPDFLSILISAKQNNPQYSAITPQIRFFEPNDRLWNCGGELVLFGFWRKYHHYNAPVSVIKNEPSIKEISFVTGCSLLYDYKELGKLTEDYFFGEEDFEFSLRLKKQNKKIACVKDSLIYHKVGGSTKNLKVNTGKRYIHILNRLINTRKMNNVVLWLLIAPLIILYDFVGLVSSSKLGLIQALRYSFSLSKDALTLNGVTQQKFLETLKKKKW